MLDVFSVEFEQGHVPLSSLILSVNQFRCIQFFSAQIRPLLRLLPFHTSAFYSSEAGKFTRAQQSYFSWESNGPKLKAPIPSCAPINFSAEPSDQSPNRAPLTAQMFGSGPGDRIQDPDPPLFIFNSFRGLRVINLSEPVVIFNLKPGSFGREGRSPLPPFRTPSVLSRPRPLHRRGR